MNGKFPILSTNRLILSLPTLSDIADIVKHVNNPRIADATATIPYPYQRENAVAWIKMATEGFDNKTVYIFAIKHQKVGEVIGGSGHRRIRNFK